MPWTDTQEVDGITLGLDDILDSVVVGPRQRKNSQERRQEGKKKGVVMSCQTRCAHERAICRLESRGQRLARRCCIVYSRAVCCLWCRRRCAPTSLLQRPRAPLLFCSRLFPGVMSSRLVGAHVRPWAASEPAGRRTQQRRTECAEQSARRRQLLDAWRQRPLNISQTNHPSASFHLPCLRFAIIFLRFFLSLLSCLFFCFPLLTRSTSL